MIYHDRGVSSAIPMDTQSIGYDDEKGKRVQSGC